MNFPGKVIFQHCEMIGFKQHNIVPFTQSAIFKDFTFDFCLLTHNPVAQSYYHNLGNS